jgi:hypothetical protein
METIIPTNIPPKFPKNFWEKLGQDQAFLIHNDAMDGIMQDGSRNHPYNKDYAKQKANYMKRKTAGDPLYMSIKGKKGMYFKNPKTKSGKHLGNILTGQQVVSNETRFVNMKLTGATFDGLKSSPKAHPDDLGVTIGYQGKDGDKVIYNQERGYDIWGMRKENLDYTFNEILNLFDEEVKKIWEKNITVTIG